MVLSIFLIWFVLHVVVNVRILAGYGGSVRECIDARPLGGLCIRDVVPGASRVNGLQGYLTYKKPPPPRTIQ